jgi:2-polyprenyl-3-methyl-5-hydroxy-6-metoxy-1,4-benzoquinol methylase
MSGTLADLQDDLRLMAQYGVSAEYCAKQMHRLPQAPVVDRVQYILTQCQGRRVLHLGCSSGPLHGMIDKVAISLTGWDIDPYPGKAPGTFVHIDLDNLQGRCCRNLRKTFDLVVVAEILEHLGNPGRLLSCLHDLAAPLLITVPNAFSAVARHHIQGGIENVHKQHTAWYSWRTLATLVERYGYTIEAVNWYNCPQGEQAQESEGLIMRVV